MTGYALQMEGISKEFPGVKALDSVTLSVNKGEIHALCGENGAGKSTLMKILSGVYPSGSFDGKIVINEREVRFRNIKESQEAGIAIIYQELALVPEMTVGENIFLSSDLMREKVLNWNKLYAESKRWLDHIGLNIDPQRKLGDLTVGKQQLIEIVKALTKNAEILILDEPTAALTESEVEVLVEILKDLKSEGVTCIYISHKLGEVMRLADSVTVLRDGQTIDTFNVNEITEDTIVSNMVGRSLTNYFPYEEHETGEEILSVKNYSFYNKSTDETIADNVSFTLRKGEILGISGLMGAGRSELFISLFGGYPGKAYGEVTIDGKPAVIKKPSDAISAGLAYVSEDRKRYGLVIGMEITKNSTLAALKKVMPNGLIDASLELKSAEEMTNKLNLKAHSLEAKVEQLSGGNQQKVVLSKWLFTNPKILILDEPTRGIDVGAKNEIYKIINELSQQGVGIIMISSELPEILGMSDRILVMADGTISGELSREEATEENVMKLATGGNNHEPIIN
ncbi:xylose ABC transporter ATP-binding protein [Lentibacillus amyloliquefaciens]|uniref:D-ribose transporter ATP-binding protein n=1 Tax=Lentibacillus amyloliquefaciens TaxID=1472767 RepID=A0A0U4EHQ8_9BACI|nr:xylose ABC transporter ATP-binding protein [Lentibacillus amyloliquefaciens]ALX50009.1 D-ribose transporter ATP-binding protein [Lentibacillus amyloliquefaciens]